MSNYKAFFDFSQPYKKTVLPAQSSRKASAAADTASLTSLNTLCKSESGTEYAKEYIEEEERLLLEQSKKNATGNNPFDEVSIGTMQTSNLNDVIEMDLNQIHRTYNLAYRPKQQLPVNAKKDNIISMIGSNSVVVIQGPTGCGKTTQVPQFILDQSFRKKQHCNIIVTQPRRIAATSIAKRVSEERDWPVGTLVGYKVGMLNKTSRDTRLTYCTTGVLLRSLIRQKNMLNYTHVILDEVHERDQDMDFLLLVVRKLLRTNSRSVKVVLMSATIDVDKFSRYFSYPINDKMEPAPIIDIAKEHAFEIEKYYLCQLSSLGMLPKVSIDCPRISPEMMDICVKLIVAFDELDCIGEDVETNRHVVLIFLPGIWEIEELHQTILNFIDKSDPKWDVVVLHSTVTNEEQQVVFEPPPEGYRRIILSTNIAESSITVPDVKYVIDFCLAKTLVTSRETNFQCLEVNWASKANCEQRAGRTGRTIAGRVYRLVPKQFYDECLVEESPPEMQRAPLEHVVLNAKLLDMGSPKSLLALSLDPPDLSNLERTILLLKEAGAIINIPEDMEAYDGKLTGLGRTMASLPVNINVSKLIALGHAFGVLRSAIIIGASMSTKSVFSTPFQKRLQAYSMKLKWSECSSSDSIAFLNVFNMWSAEKANRHIKDKKSEKLWAERHFIQLRVLYEINTLITELTTRLKYAGIHIPAGIQNLDDPKIPEHSFILKTVIAGAFYPHYFQNTQNEITAHDNLKEIAGLDPNRTVFVKGWPHEQPGALYVKNFQRIFEGCCGIKQVTKTRVTFDNTNKAYITFGADSMKLKHIDDPAEFKVPGKVSTAVYRALKMRDNGDIRMPLMSVKEAKQKMIDLNIKRQFGYSAMYLQPNQEGQMLNEVSGDNEQTPEKQQPVNGDAVVRYKYVRPELPSLDTVQVPVIFTEISDPSQFWVRNKKTYSMYREIETEVQNDSKLILLDHEPFIGELVIASFSDKGRLLNYRAMIQNITIENNQEKVGLFFVDTGKVHEAFVSDLRQFEKPNQVMTYPSLAWECTLMGVKPVETRRVDGNYTSEAREAFKKIVLQAMCYIEVYSVVNGLITVTLKCDFPDRTRIEVNDWLVTEGHAEYREEGYVSKKSHEVREMAPQLNEKQKQFYEENQHDQNDVQFKVAEISEADCNISVTLRGPYSPLEMQLFSLILAGSGKKVKIMTTSVNSVLLNSSPDNDQRRLLVAGQVLQGQSGAALNIDNTTLMPNVAGLTSLLVLIFAPKIELRRNRFGDRYSSGLCGLGHLPITNQSLFPEHDMEVGFDVEIDNNDLLLVNKLRHWFNVILDVPEVRETDEEETANCQEKVRKTFLAIFEKERLPQKIQFTKEVGKWKQYDDSLVLQPANGSLIKSTIYPLHNALELVPKDPLYEEMVEHIDELRAFAASDPQKCIEEIICKFCKEAIFGVFQLRMHIMSARHDENVRKYGILMYT